MARILPAVFLLSLPPLLGANVTYNEHIAPLVHQHCSECHRPGQAGPFSLLTFADVSKKSRTILRVVNDRYMPPWHPADGHVAFEGNRSLSPEEVDLFNQWVETGKPQGEGEEPAPPSFRDGWALGTPDLIVSMKEAYPVPAEGPDIYRNFAIPLNLKEDKWVTAVELRPGARSVVHHSLFFLDASGEAVEKDGTDGKPGFRGMGFRKAGSLGAYVPGNTPRRLPGGLAMALPKGSDLVLASHFHPSGKAVWEKSTVGLYFADAPPPKPLANIQVPPGFGRGVGIDIPAGESNYQVTDEFELPVAVDAISVGGHAHYLCSTMKMTAQLPSGESQVLLEIQDWDLNWQDRYFFEDPVRLPAGTVLKTDLVYDNSEENPDNPFFPPKRVRWGHESTDEMGSITLLVTPVDLSDEKALDRAARMKQVEVLGAVLRNPRDTLAIGLAQRIQRLDVNSDGIIQGSEIPQRFRAQSLQKFDANGDGSLEKGEIDKLVDSYRDGERLFR